MLDVTHATDSTHSEDAQHFSLGIMAESGLALPGPRAQRRQGNIRLAQGSDHEENANVGGGMVDCDGSARDEDSYMPLDCFPSSW